MSKQQEEPKDTTQDASMALTSRREDEAKAKEAGTKSMPQQDTSVHSEEALQEQALLASRRGIAPLTVKPSGAPPDQAPSTITPAFSTIQQQQQQPPAAAPQLVFPQQPLVTPSPAGAAAPSFFPSPPSVTPAPGSMPLGMMPNLAPVPPQFVMQNPYLWHQHYHEQLMMMARAGLVSPSIFPTQPSTSARRDQAMQQIQQSLVIPPRPSEGSFPGVSVAAQQSAPEQEAIPPQERESPSRQESLEVPKQLESPTVSSPTAKQPSVSTAVAASPPHAPVAAVPPQVAGASPPKSLPLQPEVLVAEKIVEKAEPVARLPSPEPLITTELSFLKEAPTTSPASKEPAPKAFIVIPEKKLAASMTPRVDQPSEVSSSVQDKKPAASSPRVDTALEASVQEKKAAAAIAPTSKPLEASIPETKPSAPLTPRAEAPIPPTKPDSTTPSEKRPATEQQQQVKESARKAANYKSPARIAPRREVHPRKRRKKMPDLSQFFTGQDYVALQHEHLNLHMGMLPERLQPRDEEDPNRPRLRLDDEAKKRQSKTKKGDGKPKKG